MSRPSEIPTAQWAVMFEGILLQNQNLTPLQ